MGIHTIKNSATGDVTITMDGNAVTSGGFRLYVIGDIHGRADLLDRIVDEIYRDIEKQHTDNCITITLGDYIDRGPDSRSVIDRLARNPFPTEYVALMGNHEALFEKYLNGAPIGDYWRNLGGLETLHSYGVPVKELLRGRSFDEAAAALKTAIPDEHRQFLSSLRISVSIGSYFLCHAGVRPDVPLANQSADDLIWIRDEFLNSTKDFGKMVIHGHSPVEWPDIRSNRINIDTGAFATGRLTCLVLDGDRGRFLYTA
jgi:serine/threonine protein phosphatase 1